MYFKDLTLLRYHFGPFDAANWQTPLLAVGWLEHPYPYLKSNYPSGLEAKIQRMVEQAKANRTHDTFRGLHCCSLCEAEGHVRESLLDSHHNLFVPGTSVIYVAPAGITHYLRQHLYQPADDFATAVNCCPEYGTSAYFTALRAANNGCKTPFEVREEEFRLMRENWQKAGEARHQRKL